MSRSYHRPTHSTGSVSPFQQPPEQRLRSPHSVATFERPSSPLNPHSNPLPQTQWSDIPLPYRPKDWTEPDEVATHLSANSKGMSSYSASGSSYEWRMRPKIPGMGSLSRVATSLRSKRHKKQDVSFNSSSTASNPNLAAFSNLSISPRSDAEIRSAPGTFERDQSRSISQPNTPRRLPPSIETGHSPMGGLSRATTMSTVGESSTIRSTGSSLITPDHALTPDAAFEDESDLHLFAQAMVGLGDDENDDGQSEHQLNLPTFQPRPERFSFDSETRTISEPVRLQPPSSERTMDSSYAVSHQFDSDDEDDEDIEHYRDEDENEIEEEDEDDYGRRAAALGILMPAPEIFPHSNAPPINPTFTNQPVSPMSADNFSFSAFRTMNSRFAPSPQSATTAGFSTPRPYDPQRSDNTTQRHPSETTPSGVELWLQHPSQPSSAVSPVGTQIPVHPSATTTMNSQNLARAQTFRSVDSQYPPPPSPSEPPTEATFSSYNTLSSAVDTISDTDSEAAYALDLDLDFVEEPVHGHNDVLPDYAQSQAEAQADQRVEAMRRANELQQRWLQSSSNWYWRRN